MRALRQTIFFNEISGKNRLVRQLTIYMPATPEHTLIVALCREAPDFSERDCAQFELLRPHITTAWQRAWKIERHQREMERLRARWPAAANQSEVRAAVRQRFALSPREADVLSWVAQGKTNSEIAIILGLAPGTIKFYVERILSKLACETRTAAAHMMFETVAGS
jgi:DNA-binding CsgD family transcriptional regulator